MSTKKSFNPRKMSSHTMPRRSLIDHMIDNREYESLAGHTYELSLAQELQKLLSELESIRKKPAICYLANMMNPGVPAQIIDSNDDVPFREMVATIPVTSKSIDVVLSTPGGSAQQVSSFVQCLRARFEEVDFIIVGQAMSAGTIFALSGNDIIMSESSRLGPIDPQVSNRKGEWYPAQGIMTFLHQIRTRGQEKINKGESPDWSDVVLLNSLDYKELGNVINATAYSSQLATKYLREYKYAKWDTHSTNGTIVTDAEKDSTAKSTADLLCNHEAWKSHSHSIDRNELRDKCKLKTIEAESVDGLERWMRRMNAVLQWSFSDQTFTKFYISNNYFLTKFLPPHGN